MSKGIDESYWKDLDSGEVNENGHMIGEDFVRNKDKADDPKVKEQAHFCSICYQSDQPEGIKRELVQVAETPKKNLAVWLCKVCDGDALEISRSQPS
jgi:hypothetical protein